MLNPQIYIVIAVAVAVIVGFLSGKVHYALVGIFCLVSLQVTGVLTAEQAWSGFSNTSVVMFASMFVLSAAFRKTSFLFKVQQKLINAKGGERTLVATCLIVAFVFGFFLSATAAAAALAGEAPAENFSCEIKIRNLHHPARARVTLQKDGSFSAEFEEPQLSVTAGQSAVLYDGDIVLGGGMIV